MSTPSKTGTARGRWLWIVPISEKDRQLAKEHGSASLISRLAAQQRSWIAGPGSS